MKIGIIAFRFFVLMTLLTGVVYPFLMTSASQILFSNKANGSLIKNKDGVVVGSELIAQGFKQEKYFWPRPSAIDYNPMLSGGSNLGPTSQDLRAKVKERETTGATGDLLFASGSGLDPHISPESAQAQITRIAGARNVNESKVMEIVNEFVEARQLSFLGENRVNVVRLNIALDERLR